MRSLCSILLICALCGCAACTQARRATDAPETSAQTSAAQEQDAPVVFEAETAQSPDAPLPQELPAESGTVTDRALDSGAQCVWQDGSCTITGGTVELTVTGRAFERTVTTVDGGAVRLVLRGGASFSGTFDSETATDVSVDLDAESKLVLSQDTRVDAIINADTAFQNVVSNGFQLEYNSENSMNAYLAHAALALPGGGQLIPII